MLTSERRSPGPRPPSKCAPRASGWTRPAGTWAWARPGERYGGLDLPATRGGTVAALGMTVLVGGLLAGAGTVGYQRGLQGQEQLSVAGLVAGLMALLIGFLVGGWVAGRMARYDGGGNGLMTAVRFLVLGAATAAVGAWVGWSYDVFDRLRLPSGSRRTPARRRQW